MQRLLFGLVFTLLAALAQAATFDDALGVTFPDEIAGVPFAGSKEFSPRELGRSFTYQQGMLRASVFVYTGGMSSIEDGPDSEKLRAHFEQVIGDVKRSQATGQLRAVIFQDDGPQKTAFPGCGPQFLWRSHDLVFSETVTAASYTYLTAVRNNFVKLRITYPKDASYGKEEVDRFVMQLRDLVGKCPRQ